MTQLPTTPPPPPAPPGTLGTAAPVRPQVDLRPVATLVGGVTVLLAGVYLTVRGPRDVGLPLVAAGCAELGVKAAALRQ